MIGLIWAQDPNGIIGVDGKIPWSYPGDLKRFKEITMGSTIVMGRKTYESIGRALPGRQNIVLSRSRRAHARDVVWAENWHQAKALATRLTIWVIGGAEVYDLALADADVIDVTLVPNRVECPDGAVVTRLQPYLDPTRHGLTAPKPHPYEAGLTVCRCRKFK